MYDNLKHKRKSKTALFAVATMALGIFSSFHAAPEASASTAINVGPGQTYENIGDVPFGNLGPGDTVRIHWRSEPYKEKFLITRSGTQEHPITIEGVPGPSGQLPVIDGKDATMDDQFDFGYFDTSKRGLIVITSPPHDDWGYKPSHIVIQNLELTGAADENSWTNEETNTVEDYFPNVAGVFVERGEYITLRNNIIHENSNGFFVGSSGSEEQLSRNILIEGNYFYDNGNPGTDQHHHSYTEAVNTVIQYNYFGEARTGASANAIKDRSGGSVVRYNYIEPGRYAHALDLVEPEDSALLMINEPNFADTYVYGNIINAKNPNTGTLVHFGGDLNELGGIYHRPTLHFYNNTVSVRMDQRAAWRKSVFQVSVNSSVYAGNNIFYNASITPNATPTELVLATEFGDLTLGSNWISPGYTESYTYTGTVSGLGNLITIPGNDPDFVDEANGDFHLLSTSGAIDQGETLNVPSAYTVDNQLAGKLDPLLGELRPTGSTPQDFGAFEYGPSGQPRIPEASLFPVDTTDDQADEPPSEDGNGGNNGGNGGSGGGNIPTTHSLYNVFSTVNNIGFTSGGNGNASVEFRENGVSDLLAARLSNFSNAWSVPKQITLGTPASLSQYAAGDRLVMDVKLDGTPSNSNPNTIIFYFNGVKGATHWVASQNLTLGEYNTVSLDLSGILANLGGSINQIGILTGYGWPTGAEVSISNIRFEGTGTAW